MKSFVVDKLMACAKAIESRDLDGADLLFKEIRILMQETDSATRKVVNYFSQALARRVHGLHPPNHDVALVPPTDIKFVLEFQFAAFLNFAHSTARTAIFDNLLTAEDQRLHYVDNLLTAEAQRLHYVEFSITQGYDPRLHDLFGKSLKSIRLTSIVPKLSENSELSENSDHLPYGKKRIQKQAEIGKFDLTLEQLEANSVADIIECMDKITIRENETLVVNWFYQLHILLAVPEAIDQVLTKLKKLKPKLVVIAEQEANHNVLDFLDRFGRSFHFYSTIFNMLECDDGFFGTNWKMSWETYFRRQIDNVVAREGIDRIERHETRAQWADRMHLAGFRGCRLKVINSGFSSKDIEIKNDGFLVLCWRNHPLVAASVWELNDDTPQLDGQSQNTVLQPSNLQEQDV